MGRNTTFEALAVEHGSDVAHFADNTDVWATWDEFLVYWDAGDADDVIWRWDLQFEGSVPLLRLLIVRGQFSTVAAHVVRLDGASPDQVTRWLRRHWDRLAAMWAPVAPGPRARRPPDPGPGDATAVDAEPVVQDQLDLAVDLGRTAVPSEPAS
jgi:hypothetical protein